MVNKLKQVRENNRGFTLLELMVIVAILGILTVVGISNYIETIRKSREGATKGNLGSIRSALSIYYAGNEGFYPIDDLSSLPSGHYMASIPNADLPPYHIVTNAVTDETSLTDSGGWSYDNVNGDSNWGSIHVGCLHQDTKGVVWSTY